MNINTLQVIMLEKGITIEEICEALDLKRNEFIGILHGDKEVPKRLRVFLGTHE